MYGSYNNNSYQYYDIQAETKKTEARSVFSRCHLALFFYLLIASAIAVIVQIVLMLTLAGADFDALFDNVYFVWLLNLAPMYLVALPVFYLITKGMDIRVREKRKMSAVEFLLIFLICQAALAVGNSIGTSVVSIIEFMTGRVIESGTIELIESTPLWLIFIVVVVVGPIVEEFIFRKILIDRFSKFGDLLAIIVSSVSFGLIHGNLSQMFYAALLGMVLGYVYTKTGNFWYNTALHMMINFFGAFLSKIFLDIEAYIEEATLALESGLPFDTTKYLRSAMALGSYTAIQTAMVIGGFVVFFIARSKKKIQLTHENNYQLPLKKGLSAAYLNVGTVLYLALSFVTIALSTILG